MTCEDCKQLFDGNNLTALLKKTYELGKNEKQYNLNKTKNKCKHLRDKRMNEHTKIVKEDNGTYTAYQPHECSIEGVRFCPFCGEKLK